MAHSEPIGVGNSDVMPNTGCKNWETAALQTITAPDANVCAEACRETRKCVAVNFQFERCAEDPRHMHEDGGLCDLLSQECETGTNRCWTLYTLPRQERYSAVRGSDHLGENPDDTVGSQELFRHVTNHLDGHYGSA